jgi:hypothetical protein
MALSSQQHVERRDEIDAVLVVTWNDFTEATVIEPTEDYGYREIAATQEYAAGPSSGRSAISTRLQPATGFRPACLSTRKRLH